MPKPAPKPAPKPKPKPKPEPERRSAPSARQSAPPKPAARAGSAAFSGRWSVGALAAALDSIAPGRLAESWDNTGLLLGNRGARCARVLLTIDFTRAVLAEALKSRVDAVVAYHPPIFHPLKRLTADDPHQSVLLDAVHAGIAVLSPHTALDACKGGVNDWLAEGVAGSWRDIERARGYEPLKPAHSLPGGEAFKIVVWVPHDAAVRVRDAMAQAGAGVIGRYDRCSTMTPVIGTFRGLPESRPAVGVAGRLEEVAEIRLEMVAAAERVAWAVAAMRAVHPYETPAFEVHGLAARPSLDEGQGRLIVLRTPATASQVASRLRKHLNTARIELAASPEARNMKHERIGLCAGAGFSLASEAFARGATLFVTGEARHHEQLSCVAQGCALLLAGHSQTERGYLPRLAARLASGLPGVSFQCSKKDAHPLSDA